MASMGASRLRQLAETLRQEASTTEVADLPVPVAAELVEDLAHCERVLAALRVRCGRRVTEAGGHRSSGDRDAASYLARVSGSSRAKARGELELAERIEELPEVRQALAEGRVSIEQARVIAPAAEADPAAAGALLSAAGECSFAELRDRSAGTVRAKRRDADLVDEERRVHRRRYCRTWAPEEGGFRLAAWVTAAEGAKILAALTKKTDQLLATSDEPVEQLRADALVVLCAGQHVTTEVCLRADAQALVRGEVEDGEVCELPGVGPVSVEKARSLLGEAWTTLLVTDGADIRTVTSTTRVIPRRVRKALEERDRFCVVPGCDATLHLEVHHWRCEFGKGGLTELDNLCRLCSAHHKMASEGGWRILGGPGRWRWLPTGRPPSGAPRRAPSGGRPPPRRPARSSR